MSSLFPIENVSFPPALSDNIASIYLRSETNDPGDGFSFPISANFGVDNILIKVDDCTLSATIEIYKSNICLEYINCTGQIIDDVSESTHENLYKEEINTVSGRGASHSLAAGGDASLGISLGGAGGGGLKLNASGGKTHSAGYEKKTQLLTVKNSRPYGLLNANRILIAKDIHFPGYREPLQGPVLSNYRPLRVKPASECDFYGVLARVVVQENWINIANIEMKESGTASQIINYLRDANDKKKRAFGILLRYLVIKKLQNVSNTQDACIAMSGCFFKAQQSDHSMSGSRQMYEGLRIDATWISDFIKLSEAGAERFLERHNISRELSVEPQSIDLINIEAVNSAIESTLTPPGEAETLTEFRNSFGRIKLPRWQDISTIPMSKTPVTSWIGVYLNTDGAEYAESVEDCYVKCLLCHPVIPWAHWINLCVYAKYKYEEYEDSSLARKVRSRAKRAFDMEMENFSEVRCLYCVGDDEDVDGDKLRYDVGSWFVNGLGLLEQNYTEDESSIYQLAVTLDNAKEVCSSLNMDRLCDALRTNVSAEVIPDTRKLLAISVMHEAKIMDEIIPELLDRVSVDCAPGLQIGIINSIGRRSGVKIPRGRKTDIMRAIARNTYAWMERMSDMSGRKNCSFEEFERVMLEA